MVSTTHFIKKSVMVPIKVTDSGEIVKPENTEHPFMRGIMKFDDYNYSNYNSYILIEQPSQLEK